MSENESDKQSKPVTVEQVLEVLENGDIQQEHGIMRWSSNYAFLVTVEQDDMEVAAVYKPQTGERPLWDFPDGTLCYREAAAFITSQELGWQIVPPTALRDGPRGLGSVQFFIDHDPEVNYFSLEEDALPHLMRIAAFDYAINNADRKGGHCLVDAQGHIWGIDHGICFHSDHKLRTVIWNFAGQTVPESILEDLSDLCGKLSDSENPYTKQINELLSPREVAAFQSRLQRLASTRRFPRPGPGPNYPWPPV